MVEERGYVEVNLVFYDVGIRQDSKMLVFKSDGGFFIGRQKAALAAAVAARVALSQSSLKNARVTFQEAPGAVPDVIDDGVYMPVKGGEVIVVKTFNYRAFSGEFNWGAWVRGVFY